MKRLILAAAAVVAFGFVANAQMTLPQTQTRGTTAATKMTTQDFVNKAAIMNMFELDAARFAQTKVTDQGFKSFVEMIITDHTKLGDELKSKATGMQLPTSLDQDHQQQLQDLKSATTQFEQKYRTNQIQAHEKAIRLFQDYAQTGDNADLKSWAQASVATLQKHLQKAEGLTKPTGTM